MNACGGDNPTDVVDADKWHRWHVGFARNLFTCMFFMVDILHDTTGVTVQ